MVHALYVEKKSPFDVEAQSLLTDLRTVLDCPGLTGLRVLQRYFVESICPEHLEAAKSGIFAEPQVDVLYEALPAHDGALLASEPLPGQFDARSESCADCISLAYGCPRPKVRAGKIFLFQGDVSSDTLSRIEGYLINPVECRAARLDVPNTLETPLNDVPPVAVAKGFTALSDEGLAAFIREWGLAMDQADLRFCRDYFANTEKRDPTVTELRVIDTYWSDHCRHTTFSTELEYVFPHHFPANDTFEEYKRLRQAIYGPDTSRPMTLMDIATIGIKALKREGYLTDLDESDEVNACSVNITVNRDGTPEDWLLLFKNETHNHPTEIEPFGGAATCLGGAIRDPLSGRGYVYQAMRVTGCADPTVPVSQTRPGKLPQRKLTLTAAQGYSSYGNQIGLATGIVSEVYHPGYEAKRMEIGAVLGAVPKNQVVRKSPKAGDVVLLLGGKTGRDGCGGATGSSKSHDDASLATCGAEVQKGNPPMERKIQRLFRKPEVSRLILRCNDFGAGGVSVAIGELAAGLDIDLDAIPTKYQGLDGTELAISESQERMAVVVDAKDVEDFCALAAQEDLEAVPTAVVTDNRRLHMDWRGQRIVSLSRDFLDTNGAPKSTAVVIDRPAPRPANRYEGTLEEMFVQHLSDLNFCSQKGLIDRFDSTIGAASVLLPLGGITQLTPAQAMAAKLPVEDGDTDTVSLMSWGFDPKLSSADPYLGALNAVIHSVCKVVATGGSADNCWLSLQEYFPRLGDDPYRWGLPTAALLGALEAQLRLKIGAVGGKDSMSGSFLDLDVPPTLVSFAVSTSTAAQVVSPEWKQPGSPVYLLYSGRNADGLPHWPELTAALSLVERLIAQGKIRAAWAIGSGGIAEGLAKMCFGNRLGFAFDASFHKDALFAPNEGGFLLEAAQPLPGLAKLGVVTEEYTIVSGGETVDLQTVQEAFEQRLNAVFSYTPVGAFQRQGRRETVKPQCPAIAPEKAGAPRVLIPVFPGTNCEYDTAKAFLRAGAKSEVFVLRTRTPAEIAQSAEALAKALGSAQILALPGGFSGGDEPEGSAKLITAFLRNPAIADALTKLLSQRDGLALGICNGFQALIKLGLLPYGDIRSVDAQAPTLTFNVVPRLQSMMVRTAIVSNRSPWLSGAKVGDVYAIPISHGEGRFVAGKDMLEDLFAKGQVACQYVDEMGRPTQDGRFNPNGSYEAIEGILSPDGRILGKMGHCERYAPSLYKNFPDASFLDIFSWGVSYFR